MVEVFEPVCHGREHASFNAALLEAACVVAGEEQVTFHGESFHVDAVREVLPSEIRQRIQWNSVETPPRHLRRWFPRLIKDFSLLFSLFYKRKSTHQLIILSGVTEAGLLADKLFFFLLSIVNPSLRVVIVFHSILPWFLYSKKRRIYLSKLRPSCMKYVVLGEHIVVNVEGAYPDVAGVFSSIRHPYSFSSKDISEIHQEPRPKGFGFVGVGSRAKGFPEFLKMIEKTFLLSTPSGSQQFHMIGRVAADCKPEYDEFIRAGYGYLMSEPYMGMVPLETYRERIEQVAYLVMPYNGSFYDFVCSGSSLDALLYLRPIIALKSTYFQNMFDQLGDIGYLCEDVDEMIGVVSNLLTSDSDSRWRSQVSNLHAGREFFSPTSVSKDLLKILA